MVTYHFLLGAEHSGKALKKFIGSFFFSEESSNVKLTGSHFSLRVLREDFSNDI